MNANTKKWLKRLSPPAVILLAIVASGILARLKPEPPPPESTRVLPAVEYLSVEPARERIIVESQGTVRALTQTTLISRVTGPIIEVGANLNTGAFVKKGQVLLRIDPVPYEAALAEAKAALSRARLALEQEKANADQARSDWISVRGSEASLDKAPPLVLRKPQLERAMAEVKAAEAGVRLAEQNLEFTEVLAPYDGRILSRNVDLGQTVAAQMTQLASLFATDQAEVSLPLEIAEMQLLGLLKAELPDPPLEARLVKKSGNVRHEWRGRIERTSGAIDPQSRLGAAIAVIDQPFQKDPPLQPGAFLEAIINGPAIPNAYRIPRSAVQPDGSIYLVDEDNRLRQIFPRVAHLTSDSAIITEGLQSGDRVCLTSLLFFVDGMQVEPVPLLQE